MAFRQLAQFGRLTRQAAMVVVLGGSVVSSSRVSAQETDSVESEVNAHLAAGEFGPAIDSLQGVEDQQKRSELLKQVANAQMQAGDFDSAYYAIRQMPERNSRNEAQRPCSTERVVRGSFDSRLHTLDEPDPIGCQRPRFAVGRWFGR